MTIKFGTDGWRAIIADEFTFENVSLCCQGVADYMKTSGLTGQGLIIGYDTRFGSRDFAMRCVEIFAGNGIQTLLCDRPSPTPVISYNVLSHHLAGAVVITASHNPPNWNGFKFKADYGGSASPQIVSELERHIAETEGNMLKTLSFEAACSKNMTVEINPDPDYVDNVSGLVDLNIIRSSGLNIMIDCMHGSGAGYLPMILDMHNGAITEIREEINPSFPGMSQPEPIGPNLEPLSRLVIERHGDIGIAYDGDADRVGIIDENGVYLNTLQVFALLALYLLEFKKERGPLIKSLTSSDMLFRLGEIYDVPVMETGVGFKFAGPLMIKENALIAGEESGGYGFRGHIPERDGILSSLLMLEFMAETQMKPAGLVQYLHSKVGEWHYRRKDISFSAPKRKEIEKTIEALSGTKKIGTMQVKSNDNVYGHRLRVERGWVVVRFSGTEPLVRVYAEAETAGIVDSLMEDVMKRLDI